MRTLASPEIKTGTPMFVHDFAAVRGPVEDTVRRMSAPTTGPALEKTVCSAWNSHAPILTTVQADQQFQTSTTCVHLELDGHRLRGDTGIINMRWQADGRLPSLDADLELTSFGPDWTHLHLLGRYEVPQAASPLSSRDSLQHRVMVAVVRRFLDDLSDLLARPG